MPPIRDASDSDCDDGAEVETAFDELVPGQDEPSRCPVDVRSAEARWEIDADAALGAEMTERGLELFNEWIGFIDQCRPTENTLMKSATDVIMMAGS
jgi:hypothetical protein